MYSRAGICSISTPEERARAGVFLAFQYPIEIPGVANSQFLRLAYNTVQAQRGKEELDPLEFDDFVREKMKLLEMNPDFLDRGVNEGFSGGEKKRNEILQMALLEPRLAILDETDSGLDIDALRIVTSGVNKLANADNAIVLVTHYQRLLNYIVPDYVHVMRGGPHHQDGRQGAGARSREARLRLGWRRAAQPRLVHEHESWWPATVISTACFRGSRSCRRVRLAWFNQLRAEAVERAGTLTGADYSRRGLALYRHLAAHQAVVPARARDVRRCRLPMSSVSIWMKRRIRLVFVDGVMCRSCPADSREANTKAWLLPNLLRGCWRRMRRQSSRISAAMPGFENNVFAALNTAFLHDGALIIVPRNATIAEAGASAVHRDAGGDGKPSALPVDCRSRQRGNGCRGLRRACRTRLMSPTR